MSAKILLNILLLIVLLLVSCSSNVTQNKNRLFFPASPDEPKIQFLTTIKNSTDIKGTRTAFETYVLGEEIPEQILKPYGISSAQDIIIVVDTKLGSLIRMNLKNGTFEYINPTGRGLLKKPLNCFIYDSLIFVNDIASKDIVVLNINGDFIDRFGSDVLSKPSDVIVNKNKAYVTDMDNNRVFVFSLENYKLLNSFPNSKEGDNSFLHSPTHLTINNDRIYVCDFGEFNVKEFTTSGVFMKNIGKYGQNLGEFVRPKGIAVDKDNNLYVSDAAFENVQIFNPTGKLLMFFGGPYISTGYLNLPIRINIDYLNNQYFEKYVDEKYKIKYLIYVTNQFGPDKITVYAFLDKK